MALPLALPVLFQQFHWDWLQHWRMPQHWNWHNILRMLNPLHGLSTLVLGAVVLAARKGTQRLRENRAVNWPTTDANVLAASVKGHDGYWVELQYRYFARDEYRYGKFRRHFRRKAEAESFAVAVRGLQVPVHYQPENPEVSVMVERELRFAGQISGSLRPT